MIQRPAFPVEPWGIRETELHLDTLAETESVFALANGHVGLRGNFDEGEPFGLPGTYLGGFFEVRPLPYAEAGYGYPEDGQTVVNVTNGKIIRLLVEDEPFDLRYGTVVSHQRFLDFRAGTLHREVEWVSPTGRRVKVTSTRMVSFTQRAVALIDYTVTPLEGTFPVVVQSQLVANEASVDASDDPRAAAALSAPLVCESFDCHEHRAILVHRTKTSGLRVAAAMDHFVHGPEEAETFIEAFPDLARFQVTATITPDAPLQIIKLLSYGWSGQRSAVALRDQVAAASTGARHSQWDRLLEEQRSYLDDFWARSDVELEGDAELQQAVRFGLFHTLQAGARGEQRAIAAKGLTGPGYDGHTFWDTEAFVLPVLTYTAPNGAADALRWRQQTLGLARDRAKTLGLRGAAFPWRTIAGAECSSYWPAGTGAFHINGDIASAVTRYLAVTGDEAFERETALELLVETARLWRSLGHHDPQGNFRIDGVTGPDEYSAVADNNVYTNLMAQRNLRAAADVAERHPDGADALEVDDEEIAGWRDAARAMVIVYDEALGVHPQAEGFTSHQRWNFNATAPEQYPLMLHFPYFDLYRKQVVKQADLVLALFACGDAFSDEDKARDFTYYEPLTVRDSSLSACVQAVVAAEVGQLDLAYDYFAEAALMDLGDLEHNTADGIHIASVAGTWIAAVAGFGGVRDHGGRLSFRPRLPGSLTRLKFRLMFRGRSLLVEVDHDQAHYSVLDGEPLEIEHHGESVRVSSDQPQGVAIPPITPGPAPTQPAGREP
ncbi:MAG: family 65 glycosyl hydrolase, partial [Actinomycetota bacterium]|nr:family 65 glycosyl hydrolase [Actinomycetota bacterium]